MRLTINDILMTDLPCNETAHDAGTERQRISTAAFLPKANS
jgi:hypothetical protein